MNLIFAKHRISGKEPEYKAIYITGKWFAKKGKLFPINIRNTDLQEVDVIYSLPSNDVYSHWTPQRHSKTSTRLEISNKFWAPIRHGMTLHGAVAIDGRNFLIDWKRQNVTNTGEYNAFITKSRKSDKV